MMKQNQLSIIKKRLTFFTIFLLCVLLVIPVPSALAYDVIYNPNPNVRPLIPLLNPDDEVNSIGLAGTIPAPPPTEAPTIATPTNNQSFSNDPTITVAGLCVDDLLVKVFNNNIFVGSVVCNGGSYSLQVNLFTGSNEIYSEMYDALDQPSPRSNMPIVTFNNAKFTAFGTLVTLTSSYARRGADPGKTLSWPLTLTGGNGPYALTIDWGDGQPVELKSQPIAGAFSIEHVYSSSGAYKIVIKGVDSNGVPAFLQLVGVSNGQISSTNNAKDEIAPKTKIIVRLVWWPAVVLFILTLVAFWLGRRYELLALRKRIEREAREFNAIDSAENHE